MTNPRYWLRTNSDPWYEVTEREFISAERQAGFKPKDGGNGVATSSFSSSSSPTEGKTTYGDGLPADLIQWDSVQPQAA